VGVGTVSPSSLRLGVVVERKAKVKVDVKTKSVGEIKESILASLKQRLGEQQWPVHIESLVRAESSAIVQRYIWAALGLEVSFGDVYFVSEHRLSKEQKALMAHVNERVRCLVDRWIDDAIDSSNAEKDASREKIAKDYKSAFRRLYKERLDQAIYARAERDAEALVEKVLSELEVSVVDEGEGA
jgi:hypothetical protein